MPSEPIAVQDLLQDMEKYFKNQIEADMIGLPNDLNEAIETATLSRKLPQEKIPSGVMTSGAVGASGRVTTHDKVWDDAVREQWLKQTEHNRLIALTEANKLAIEVFKSTVVPGGLVETTDEIIKSASMMAAFLNEGKIK